MFPNNYLNLVGLLDDALVKEMFIVNNINGAFAPTPTMNGSTASLYPDFPHNSTLSRGCFYTDYKVI